MTTDINNNTSNTAISRAAVHNNATLEQFWIADEALDKQEEAAATERAQEYHDRLSQMSIQESLNRINAQESGGSKDRIARMAGIVAKHAMI